MGGAVAAALLALLIGPVIFRLSGYYFAIGTLALATIIELLLLDQRRFSGGSTGYYVQNSINESLMFFVALLATVLVVLNHLLRCEDFAGSWDARGSW